MHCLVLVVMDGLDGGPDIAEPQPVEQEQGKAEENCRSCILPRYPASGGGVGGTAASRRGGSLKGREREALNIRQRGGVKRGKGGEKERERGGETK